MQKLVAFFSLFVLCCFCASEALAERIKTNDFTINIARGWKKDTYVNNADGLALTLVNKRYDIFISIAIAPGTLSTLDMAHVTAKHTAAQGWQNGLPKPRDASYRVYSTNAKQKLEGYRYFTSNGVKGSIVTIIAPAKKKRLQRGINFLKKNFNAVDKQLFPTTY